MTKSTGACGKPAMRCPRVNELPEPPAGKVGWPWSEDSIPLAHSMADADELPLVSIVTPSFNQGQFLEETIRSVLLQGYPNLEYFVMDGGSTDNSVEIIKKYSPWLTYWISEPDSGQSDAINRGLNLARGVFTTWINSDDLLCKNALVEHATRVGFERDVVYVGYCIYIDGDGNPKSLHRGRVFSLEDLVRIKSVWRAEDYKGHIDQPAVLFPLALFRSAGGLNVQKRYAMDYELWGDLFLVGARFRYTEILFGMFREHQAQKSRDALAHTQAIIEMAARLTKRAECFSEKTKNDILAELRAYNAAYGKAYWRGTGRLAKIGLPPFIVNPIRSVRRKLQKTMDN